jgi:hypothetical protein
MAETTGYLANLLGGWKLTVSAGDGACIAWLSNAHLDTGWYETVVTGAFFLDLDRLGYVPTVYHDGDETPPLVLFHAVRPNRGPYVWEPRSGRVYRAGEAPVANGRD